MKTIAYIVGFFGVLALIFGLALLFTYPVMWGINYLFTPQVLLALFGIPQMTFWKTLVLDIILGILFKSSSASSSK